MTVFWHGIFFRYCNFMYIGPLSILELNLNRDLNSNSSSKCAYPKNSGQNLYV